MKIAIFFIMVLFCACVSSAVVLRDFSKRVYYPCEVWQTKEPLGKFCYHYCMAWKFLHPKTSENCTVWGNDILDSKSADDWDKIVKANFKLGA